jgi:thymidine kinase
MSLQLVLGPMFSGKSSYLLASIRKYKEIGWSVYIITSFLDNRYTKDAKIVNHDKESCNADIAVNILDNVSNEKKFLEAKVVIIEEGQFYDDLVSFSLKCVETHGKHVIVAGLDGDAQRKPFGHLLDLIPYCDSIVKLKAYCKLCANDGIVKEALFTSKKIHNNDVIDVGSSDKYEALCRIHYIQKN